jgi:hypothetical protein
VSSSHSLSNAQSQQKRKNYDNKKKEFSAVKQHRKNNRESFQNVLAINLSCRESAIYVNFSIVSVQQREVSSNGPCV